VQQTFQIGLVFPGDDWESGSRTYVTPIVPYNCTVDKIAFANYATGGSGDMIIQTNDDKIDWSSFTQQRLGNGWTS